MEMYVCDSVGVSEPQRNMIYLIISRVGWACQVLPLDKQTSDEKREECGAPGISRAIQSHVEPVNDEEQVSLTLYRHLTLHCWQLFSTFISVFTGFFSTRISMLISTRLYFFQTAWHWNEIEQNKIHISNILHGIRVVVLLSFCKELLFYTRSKSFPSLHQYKSIRKPWQRFPQNYTFKSFPDNSLVSVDQSK